MSHEIAIIGMAGRFPGASTVEEFWNNLRSGIESVRDLTDEELAAAGWRPEVYTDPRFVRRAGVLDGEALFDAAFFDIPPADAELLCPQHRVMLECGWEVLESAGCDPSRYDGRIGVFIGATLSSYLVVNLASHRQRLDVTPMADVMIAVDKDYIPTRLSYKLNLTGPSVSVSAASSSSLVAVHLAIQSLLAGECEMALAGAVSINTRPGLIVGPGSIYSPDGRCRTFDAAANGMVSGNAAGLVALKPLVQAEADGDEVLAIIVGSAINNDGGRKASFLVPGVAGQTEAIREALAMAALKPDDIGYVEAHGMGTELGDALEVAALTKAFGESPRETRCGLGSVKPNIGYASAAAGIASLIKLTLALRHRMIPPTINFEAPNPRLNLDAGPFRVIDQLTAWDGRSPRRAGITAFGVGGTNAHLVLQERPPSTAAPPRAQELLLMSARTPAALKTSCRRLAVHLTAHPELTLRDVAFSLFRRHAFAYRHAFVASSLDAVIAELNAFASSAAPAATVGRPPGPSGELDALGRRWMAGFELEAQLFEPALARQVQLPTYPFERTRHWIPPAD